MKNKAAAGAVLLLGLCAVPWQVEAGPRRGSAIVDQARFYRSVCRSGRRLLGLCGEPQHLRTMVFTPSGGLRRDKARKSLRLFKFVRLFTDGIKIGAAGPWSIRLKLEIR